MNFACVDFWSVDFRGAVENCSVKNGVENAVKNVVETSMEKA